MTKTAFRHKKDTSFEVSFLAGAVGLEPTTNGFGAKVSVSLEVRLDWKY